MLALPCGWGRGVPCRDSVRTAGRKAWARSMEPCGRSHRGSCGCWARARGLLQEGQPAALETRSRGSGKVKNRPNSDPRTETTLIVFSVHCLSLPIYIWKMVQEELSRVGSKTGVGAVDKPSVTLCQNHFRYPEMGVWMLMHSRALRASACPGPHLGEPHPPWQAQVTSSSRGTCLWPWPRPWVRGEVGSPSR